MIEQVDGFETGEIGQLNTDSCHGAKCSLHDARIALKLFVGVREEQPVRLLDSGSQKTPSDCAPLL